MVMVEDGLVQMVVVVQEVMQLLIQTKQTQEQVQMVLLLI